MTNKVRIPNNWSPRAYQLNVWRYLEHGGKRAICIWHRRAGKDDVALHWAAASMIDKPGSYWHMLPAYLSLSWRAPMREREEKKVPIGLPLPDITMDQFMDIEDGWSAREDRV
jgi:hypothetical protein